MSFFTTIYIVAIEKLDQTLQSRAWYWDRTEANDMYEGAVDEYEDTRIVTLYSIDVQDTINKRVDDLMANRHSSINRAPLDELRSNRKAEMKPVTWSELTLTADEKALFMERYEGQDFWQYRVTHPLVNSWHIRLSEIHGDTDRIGVVYQDNPGSIMPEYIMEKDGKPVGSRTTLVEAVRALIEI